MTKKTTEKGFTLIEIMIALTILAVGILAVGQMYLSAISGNDFSREHTDALVLAQSRIDQIMNTNFTAVAAGNNTVNGYTVTWTIDNNLDFNGDASVDLRQMTVTVTRAGWARPISISFSKPRIM